MKIKNITLQNYKRFIKEETFSFCNEEGDINDITLIVGNNGSGKTSILQAITSILGSTVRPHLSPSDLDWPGFEYRYLQTGNMPLRITMKIGFSKEELDATYTYAMRLKSMGGAFEQTKIPTRNPTITLSLNYLENKVNAESGGAFFQTKGYQYAALLKPFESNPSQLFEKIGNIYWYTEQRTSFSSNQIESDKNDLDSLRNTLVSLSYFDTKVRQGLQLREGQQNFYANLEKNYKKVFPNRSFIGAAPRMDNVTKSDFWLSDGVNQYELSGMSAGERAIFPILLDFTLYNINHSIIIIDEIELHLHPSLQQALLRALPKLGKDNQFIITTHSRSVASLFSQDQIIYLD